MFEQIERLDQEVINVQVFDNYFKDGVIRTDDVFMREDYKYEIKKFQNLLKNCDDYEDDDEEIYYNYTLDDVLRSMIEDLDIYSSTYVVPEVVMDNCEWELLFETIYEYYMELDLGYFFMENMIALNKYTIARAMVYGDECIDLDTYIKSLKYLESDIISINNIIEIAENIREVLSIDAVAILANDDGSFGCKNKDATLFMVDDDVTKEELIENYIEQKGYNVLKTFDVREKEQSIETGKVIDFASNKKKIKSKVAGISDK